MKKNKIRYSTRHTTTYTYELPVTISSHTAHLVPRDTTAQRCLSSAIFISPEPAQNEVENDFFDNKFYFFTIESPHEKLVVETRSEVEIIPQSLPDASKTIAWEEAKKILSNPQSEEDIIASQFVYDSNFVKPSEKVFEYALPSFSQKRPLLEAVLDLTKRIYQDFKYDPTATSIATPLDEVIKQKSGVCQDFAHLEIACLRAMGLAARYVSGYILNCCAPDANGTPGKELVGGDASHAWISVYIPEIGWIDADPTNNILPQVDHITLAWGRDFDDVSPIKGIMTGGGHHQINVDVCVLPL